MEDNKISADFPSNYVTLAELQQRRIQEQQRKLKEKQEEKEPNPQALNIKNGQTDQRNFNRKYWPKQRGYGHCPEEIGAEMTADVVVEEYEENQSKSTLKKTRSEGWGNKEKKKWHRKKKEEIKRMEDGEARAQRQRETTMPPVKREENVPARRYETRRDRRLESKPLVTGVVQKSDWTVQIKGEVENVVDKSEGTYVKIKGNDVNVLGESERRVEIERKLGNISLQKEDGKLETQKRFAYCSNGWYRSYDRGYNRNVHSRNVEYRVYNSGVKRRTGQDRGSYGRFSRSTEMKVWVKKEEVADNGEGAGDQS